MSDDRSPSAIVAGGAGRLGREIVRRLLAGGYEVLVLDRAAPKLGTPGLEWIELDLTDEEALAAVRSARPAPRVLVNCQGWSPKDAEGVAVPASELSAHEFMRVVEANLLSCFLTMRELAPAMAAAGGGHVVNVSSTAAYTGRTPASPAYAAAKAGLDALTRCFAVWYGPRNVVVSGIAPGKFVTELCRQDSPEVVADYLSQTPLGRLGRSEDIAELVVFLASERNAHFTGQTLVVDGGRLA